MLTAGNIHHHHHHHQITDEHELNILNILHTKNSEKNVWSIALHCVMLLIFIWEKQCKYIWIGVAERERAKKQKQYIVSPSPLSDSSTTVQSDVISPDIEQWHAPAEYRHHMDKIWQTDAVIIGSPFVLDVEE